jgi:MFS family permease
MVGRGIPAGDGRPPSLRQLFAVAEFRALFAAFVASIAGDQLARVALTVLVFDRTGSAGLAGLTYALTVLPAIVGGPLLSGLADRLPRRQVMITCDVARAGLVAVMAIPALSLWALGALVVVVQLFASPFNAARAATQAAVLQGEPYVLASAVTNIAWEISAVVGFALGGAIVAGVGAHTALLIDAGTFLVSALLVRAGVRARPIGTDAGARTGQRTRWATTLRRGFRLVSAAPQLRSLVGLACIAGFYTTAVGLAVPYAAQLGGGAVTAGLLMAANPAGTALGMIIMTKWVRPAARLRILGPLAVGACAPLVVCLADPAVGITLGLWCVAGVCAAYQLPANATFVQAVPDAQRGQAFGLAQSALLAAQGLGIVLAGVAGDHWAPSTVVGAAGVLGTLAAFGAGLAWRHASTRLPDRDLVVVV